MSLNAKYTHTNLTARDWRKLVRFYTDVFGCIPKPPERDLAGQWLEDLTALPGAHLRGLHLILPGQANDAPTLEIFTYEHMIERGLPAVNEPGFGHLAFHVDQVEAALDLVRRHGGSAVGRVIATTVPGVGLLQVAYARDPEGNILELQNWSRLPQP
jgi:predicted enzyme related to lactoylglutathione lyase